MELTHPDFNYGDTDKDLTEPWLILSDTKPFNTSGTRYTSIVKHGAHRNPAKCVRQFIKDGIIPALGSFNLSPALFPFCFARWNRFLKDALHFRFNLEENYQANKPMVVSCDNESIFITFYPDRAASLVI
jgi:hypothetical protein